MTEMSDAKFSRRSGMMRRLAMVLLAGSSLALSGCVVAPAGPGYYGRGYGPPHYYRPHPHHRPYWSW